MSTEQSVDPDLVEQTKQQIRALVAEISQLSKSESTPTEFYGEFLNRIVQALAAAGGAVWGRGEGGRLQLEYQINLRNTRLTEDEESQVRHGKLLQKVLTTGEGMLVQPHSGTGGDDGGANPTDYLLVLAALKSDQDVRGVVEIFQRAGTRLRTQQGYLRFLLQMCELAGDFLKTRQLRHFSDRQTLWAQLDHFTRVAHESLEPRVTAYTIANEGRRLIECDRVSVAVRRGSKCRIEAVSGQDMFDRRSNTVKLLGKLATAVVRTGEPMWYTGDTSSMAPQVETAVQAYVDDSHSKTVAVLPLNKPGDPHGDGKPGEAIGALIVEQIEDSRPRDGMMQRVEVVSNHCASALANSIEHNSLFLLPVWRTLGKLSWVVRARTLPKTIAVLALIAGLVATLVFVPADFELHGTGTLQPVTRHDVFAGIDGEVTAVMVKHEDTVRKDQELALLRNTDLDVQREGVAGKLAAITQQIASIEIELGGSGAQRAATLTETDRLRGERSTLEEQRYGLQEEHRLLEEKAKKLTVKSPGDGQVLDLKPADDLLWRPVKQGQVLMRLADPTGDWELELLMPEDRMGHITRAMRELGDDLKVTYILATDPRTQHVGTIKEVHSVAVVRGEEGNTVRVRVTIDKQELGELLRPGAKVTAKVYCGRRSLGYTWFHDLVAFVHSRILFRVL